MKGAIYLAIAYLRHNRWRSGVMIAALALILFVPVATRAVLTAAESRLTARAEATPLMVGARGSALDLMLNGLYFSADRPSPVTMAAAERIWDSDLAIAIPLYVRYTASGAPIVGTSLDYFDMRGLTVKEGRALAVLGEVVLGAKLADRLNIGPGDSLVSDPENLFDLAGSYPLEMSVVGILAPSGTADDDAAFVDLNTAWVIEGLGHGHEDVVESGMAVASDGGSVTASAAITRYTRITPDNIDSFHFHGPPESYPISSVIAVPWDARSGTILRGRYLAPEDPTQIVVPETVVAGLLETIFRIGRVLDAVYAVVGIAALIALSLALYLGTRLRASEFETATRLGSHKLTIGGMVLAEIALILGGALALAGVAVGATLPYIDTLAIWLVSS